MATLIRSTTPGSSWTRDELRAYNITVASQDIATFFGNPTLPQPSIRQVTLEDETYPPEGVANKDDRKFFVYLEDATKPPPGEESSVDTFATHLLSLLGYDELVSHCYVAGRRDIPFFMCGGNTHAKTDACVVNLHTEIFLLVQEDKRFQSEVNPEPQLIAEAIASFQFNNGLLRKKGKKPIEKKTVPGITMIGTTPTFYKIEVTQDLVDAIETAQYPESPTIVHKLVPPVEDFDGSHLRKDGMKTLSNRAVILRCFEAFKQFVG
ncbi:hypothetical protein EDB92DRAFT_1852753 [Lactarius akahatsu]|uniref:Uncharacterized protein n=1 Tax=Lactarius akahatsu TaxID=416441 RepID=A0AAD4LK32_9AGAM|nr:hypothetical protein EDB92DRAFT_1852753 [Lactarius akahatsu]